jgi:glycosyltransferase involved in cell wall biosynthesis
VGGTNPSLLRAMHWGAPCVPINVVFHRENVGEDNPYFDKTPGHLAAILRELDADPARRKALGQQAQAHAAATFRWDAVVDGYAQLFRRLIDLKARRQRLSVDVIGEMYHPERFAPEPAPAPDKTASVS